MADCPGIITSIDNDATLPAIAGDTDDVIAAARAVDKDPALNAIDVPVRALSTVAATEPLAEAQPIPVKLTVVVELEASSETYGAAKNDTSRVFTLEAAPSQKGAPQNDISRVFKSSRTTAMS